MAQKDKVKELVGRGLGSYHTKSLQQIDRIEKKNKEQSHKISILTNELDNDYLTKTEEGSIVSLEHSKEGMIYLDELQGNTLVNYCTDGSKELTLNDEIDTEGINVTLNNTIDNGIVDISLEGNTMVNACDQKDPIAITKSYTVENSGNHIALQGEYDGKARPVIQGNTLVNYVTDGAKELTLNGDIDVEGTNVTLTEGVDNGLVDVVCEGNTMVNIASVGSEFLHKNATSWYRDVSLCEISSLKLNQDYTFIIEKEYLDNHNNNYNEFQIGIGDLINTTNGHPTMTVVSGNFRYNDDKIEKKVVVVRFTDFKDGIYLSCRPARRNTAPVEGESANYHIKIIILEGNWSNKEIPPYFEGMKSVGECEGNKFEILSHSKNLTNTNVNDWEVGSIEGRTGENTQSTTRIRTKDYFKLPLNSKSLSVSYFGDYKLAIRFFKKDKTIINGNNKPYQGFIETTTIQIPDGAYYYRLVCAKKSEQNIVPSEITNCKCQLEMGDTQPIEYTSYGLNKKEISLNEPLRGLPNGVKDRFVEIGGKWFIERNCGKIVLNGSETDWASIHAFSKTNVFRKPLLDAKNMVTDYEIVVDNFIVDKLPIVKYSTYDTLDAQTVSFSSLYNISVYNGTAIYINRNSSSDLESFKQWLSENPITVIYQLKTPIYEPIETDISLLTYLDTTYISNNSIIPCNMKITNTGYNTIIKPNTKYTIVLDTNKAGIIGINLGGTEISTSNKITTITTPSTLVDNTLKLSGQGINVDKVMLFEGDLTQTPSLIPSEYVEGLKSSFEDQLVTDEEDPNYGKYKVEYKVTGKNKFNALTTIDGYELHSTNLNIVPSSEWFVTDYIRVSPNTTYSISGKKVGNAVIFYDINKKAIKNAGAGTGSFTTTDGIYYVRLNDRLSQKSTFQLEEGTTATEYEAYKEYTKTFYLNSPLLEGDTIEDINGKATHVRRYNRVILDGVVCDEVTNYRLSSINDDVSTGFAFYVYTTKKPAIAGNTLDMTGVYSDNFKSINPYDAVTPPFNKYGVSLHSSVNELRFVIAKNVLNELTLDGVIQWLQNNPTTVVYQLASPIYEPISTESILCDSYVNGHLDFDSAIPIEKVKFGYNAIALKYVQPSTKYTIQFESDGVGKVELLNIGGKTYPYLNKDVVKGLNKITVETIQSPTHNLLIMVGIGFNASNISVVATDKEFEYFEGMKSVGECEGNKFEILSNNGSLVDFDITKASKVHCSIVGSSEKFTITTDGSANSFKYVAFSLANYTFKKGVTYTFNATPKIIEGNPRAYVRMLYKGNTMEICSQDIGSSSKKTFTPTEDITDMQLWFYGSFNNTEQNGIFEVSNIMISLDNNLSYRPYAFNKKEISLNEPLRGLPNGVKDKFVKQGGKWYVERNCKSKTLNGTEEGWYIWQDNGETISFAVANINKEEKNTTSNALRNSLCDLFVEETLINPNKEWHMTHNQDSVSWWAINIFKSKLLTQDIEGFKKWLSQNPTTVVYQLAEPTYEEITDPQVITYLDTTHISTNSTIPSNMQIKNSGYNAIIKPSTQYTVAFDTNKSGEVGINLGGAKVTTTNNVATITTPATLTDDSLRLYGKGIKGSKVRLLEGDKTNWIPSFFEGMQSSFEDKLQDDGTFKMEILSNNKNLFDISKVKSDSQVKNLGDSLHLFGYANNIHIKADFLTPNKIYTTSSKAKVIQGESNTMEGLIRFYNEKTQHWIIAKTFIAPINIKDYSMYIYGVPANGECVVSEIQIYEGENTSSYVSYKSNKIQFSSIEPLRRWDRFVFKEGKLMIERNSGVKIFNGSESWSYGSPSSGWGQNGNYKAFYTHSLSSTKKTNGKSYTTYLPTTTGSYPVNYATSEVFSLGHANYELIRIDQRKLNELSPKGLCAYLNQNPLEVVYQLKNPTYEEIPFELQKIILEGYENGTLFFDTNIPPTVTTTYAGETPIVKSVRLNKSEVLKNTDDINDNIVPYLMDMDYRVVCLQLEGGIENVSMARLFGGTFEMLQRDILSNRYSKEEYKYRLDVYLSANKITENEYEKLGDMLND